MQNYKRINNCLVLLIILVNLFVILTPILPGALYAVHASPTASRAVSDKITRLASGSSGQPAEQPALPNSVIIPSILLDQPIHDGTDIYRQLDKGILRWPYSSTPDQGGNTVLLGHRFTYRQPEGVLYALDKVKVGDTLAVTWGHRLYRYRVQEIKVVPPTDTSIESPTKDARLTIFTCTPLLWPKKRLVVVASLEQHP